MTYNVHRCLGCDGVVSPHRIARVIAGCDPDVVALQELDVGRRRTGRKNQPAAIAAELGMNHYFHPAVRAQDEHYGDALLSRLPMELVHAGPLPPAWGFPGFERRGALWARIDWHNVELHFFNTHLGLTRRERQLQTRALLGSEWLAHPDCAQPVILAGDLNAWPGSAPYRRLRTVLDDAQIRDGGRPHKTFPSRMPVLRIDHIFVSPSLHVRRVHVPRTPLTRVASDHLPLVAEVTLS
jgi:endonuclease/exonuclease/phosphatase family metal-dependent hydrolase